MINNWDFHAPTKTIFKKNFIKNLDDILEFENIILITSKTFKKNGHVDKIIESTKNKIKYTFSDVDPNPDLKKIDELYYKTIKYNPDSILALGGGSAIDTAKALARLHGQENNKIDLYDHFINKKKFHKKSSSLPLIVIPTTSGTGSEVTPFATVWDYNNKKKYSLGNDDLFPTAALLDPELTLKLPLGITISSGLDTISHALESIWNHNSNIISITIATSSLSLAIPALNNLLDSLDNLEARSQMMQASYLSGLAISKTRTALAHSISYPITNHFSVAHGIACSFTLPEVLRFNALEDDGRLHKLAVNLGYLGIEELASILEKLLHKCNVLAVLKNNIKDFNFIYSHTREMITPERADNNLRNVNYDDIDNIISNAIKGLEKKF